MVIMKKKNNICTFSPNTTPMNISMLCLEYNRNWSMIGTFVVKFNAMLREQAAVKVTLQVQTANKQMVRWRNKQSDTGTNGRQNGLVSCGSQCKSSKETSQGKWLTCVLCEKPRTQRERKEMTIQGKWLTYVLREKPHTQ